MSTTLESQPARDDAHLNAERQALDGLLTLVAQGDLPAFGQLYDRTAGRIYGLTRAILRNVSLAEEATQDVFFEIWRRAGHFDSLRGSAMSWMLTLAHSRAIDKIRSLQSLRTHDGTFARNSYGPHIDSASDSIDRAVHHRQIHQALTALTPLQRQAIHLVYFLNYTTAEASQLLNIPVPTFKGRLHSALLALRRR